MSWIKDDIFPDEDTAPRKTFHFRLDNPLDFTGTEYGYFCGSIMIWVEGEYVTYSGTPTSNDDYICHPAGVFRYYTDALPPYTDGQTVMIKQKWDEVGDWERDGWGTAFQYTPCHLTASKLYVNPWGGEPAETEATELGGFIAEVTSQLSLSGDLHESYGDIVRVTTSYMLSGPYLIIGGSYNFSFQITENIGFPYGFSVGISAGFSATTEYVYVITYKTYMFDIPISFEPGHINEDDLPSEMGIAIYPSPFNSACRISAPENAEVEVFDIEGRKIGELPGGEQVWKPEASVGSGIYLVRATVGEHEVTKRVVYLK